MVTIIVDFSTTQAKSQSDFATTLEYFQYPFLYFPFLFTKNWKYWNQKFLVFLLFRGNELFWLVGFSAGILVRKSQI